MMRKRCAMTFLTAAVFLCFTAPAAPAPAQPEKKTAARPEKTAPAQPKKQAPKEVEDDAYEGFFIDYGRGRTAVYI